MSKVVRLKKGLDIKLKGEVEQVVEPMGRCRRYAVKPTDFRALTPRLAVKVGDEVKAGDVLFFNKYRPEVKFTSPVSGRVSEIRRGERRKLLAVVVEHDGETGGMEYRDFGAPGVKGWSREAVVERLLESGVWPVVRQRPYDVVADPKDEPKAVFVSGFDSSPLAPDMEVVLEGERENLQAGIDCLAKLCGRAVNLNLREGTRKDSVLEGLENAEVSYFAGPHPSGNAGVQIHHLNPVNKGEVVWVVNVTDVAVMGRLFREGRYDARRRIAVAGSEVKRPCYVDTVAGASMEAIAGGRTKGEVEERVISGNVLTGYKAGMEDFLGFYHNMVTVIPEGKEYEFLGWASLGLNKFSMSKTFLSYLMPGRRYRLNANYHGEERAFVVTGQYERVLPMDILPVYLLKAILTEDLDKMEQLGMYEVAPEDMALCEFVCTSKIPVQEIVERGIALMMKELS